MLFAVKIGFFVIDKSCLHGQVLAFYHAPGDHDLLRKRLLQTAKAIADFYDTTYLTQKFEKTLWPWDFSDGMLLGRYLKLRTIPGD
ncbi:MAG: hypothetical protein R6X07_15025 [Desulfatiglandales bacterium]